MKQIKLLGLSMLVAVAFSGLTYADSAQASVSHSQVASDHHQANEPGQASAQKKLEKGAWYW